MEFLHVVMNVPYTVNGVAATQGDILSIITPNGVKHEALSDTKNAIEATTDDDSTCGTMPGGVSCWKKDISN